MKIVIKLSNLIIGMVVATMAGTAAAHHSMTEFDRNVVAETEGVVSRISWRNPHIMLEVTSTAEDGVETVYHLEGNAESMLRRRGVTSDNLSVGEAVRVAGWPSTRRDNYIQVNHILLSDGIELLTAVAREPRWTDNHLGTARDVFAPDDVAAASGDGIFRVWSQAVPAWFFNNRSGWRLTEAAAAAVAEWDDIADNPIMQCIPPGMPSMMGNPYPMEFRRVGENIEVAFEEFDARRVIHMGENIADPEDVPLSLSGYSVGRWEGDTLVVDTFRLSQQYFNRAGAPQTPNAKINERFTVVEDGKRLNYLMTVDEPATLVEPFVWDAHFVWKPGEQVSIYGCELEDWTTTESTLTN